PGRDRTHSGEDWRTPHDTPSTSRSRSALSRASREHVRRVLLYRARRVLAGRRRESRLREGGQAGLPTGRRPGSLAARVEQTPIRLSELLLNRRDVGGEPDAGCRPTADAGYTRVGRGGDAVRRPPR